MFDIKKNGLKTNFYRNIKEKRGGKRMSGFVNIYGLNKALVENKGRIH